MSPPKQLQTLEESLSCVLQDCEKVGGVPGHGFGMCLWVPFSLGRAGASSSSVSLQDMSTGLGLMGRAEGKSPWTHTERSLLLL